MSAAEKSSVTNEAELLHEGRRKFRLEKLSKEAQKNWDHFYRRHGDNFFKDRHWTQREFTDLCPDIQWEVSLSECGATMVSFVCHIIV